MKARAEHGLEDTEQRIAQKERRVQYRDERLNARGLALRESATGVRLRSWITGHKTMYSRGKTTLGLKTVSSIRNNTSHSEKGGGKEINARKAPLRERETQVRQKENK